MQTLDASIEILDLRHFAAPVLRPVLEAEGELWEQRLHWDYRASARLLMQYLDNHMLPGYAALEAGKVTGYVFCVYEETKAVIGDVFALPGPLTVQTECPVRPTPGKRRCSGIFSSCCSTRRTSTASSRNCCSILPASSLRPFARLDSRSSAAFSWCSPGRPLEPAACGSARQPGTAPLARGRPGAAARLICEAYRDHPDSLINDQYRSVHGSMRFLNNIVRYAGCGTFATQASYVVVERTSRELVALVLGSRVSEQSGHLTQVCVHPAFRRRGLARLLLAQAAFSFMRLGATEISLTVTEANSEAIELYKDEGYQPAHSFDAAVWQRTPAELERFAPAAATPAPRRAA